MGNYCPSSVDLDDMVTYRNTINSLDSAQKIAALPLQKNALISLILAVKNYELKNIPYTITPIGSTTTETCAGPITINKDNLLAIKKQLNEKAEILNLGHVSGFNSDNNPIPFPEVAYISLINNIPDTSVQPICQMAITKKINQEESIANFINRANIDPTIIDYGYIDVLNSIDGIKAFETKLPNYYAKSPSDLTIKNCNTLNIDASQLINIKHQHNILIKFFNTKYGKPLIIPFPEAAITTATTVATTTPILKSTNIVLHEKYNDTIIKGIPNVFIYFVFFIIFIFMGYISLSYMNAKQIQRNNSTNYY